MSDQQQQRPRHSNIQVTLVLWLLAMLTIVMTLPYLMGLMEASLESAKETTKELAKQSQLREKQAPDASSGSQDSSVVWYVIAGIVLLGLAVIGCRMYLKRTRATRFKKKLEKYPHYRKLQEIRAQLAGSESPELQSLLAEADRLLVDAARQQHAKLARDVNLDLVPIREWVEENERALAEAGDELAVREQSQTG